LQNDFKNHVRHQTEDPFIFHDLIGLYLPDVVCCSLSWNQLFNRFNRSFFVGRTFSAYIYDDGDQQIYRSYKECRQPADQVITELLSQEIEPGKNH